MQKRKLRAWEAINQQDSSAVAMRSVADALRGEFVNVWNTNTWQQRALRLVGMGGKKASITAIERFVATSGVDPSMARRITARSLATWAVSLYEDVQGPCDAVIIGAPNGGVAHLAVALGAPFLSQHFLVSYEDPTPPDDVKSYQEHGAELAKATLRRSTDLAVVNHYDPLHDRFLVKYVNHLRYKLLDLPEAYKAFIYQVLRPGGKIIFTDCRYAWPMYFIGERHWFQVGGLGGLSPRDFIEGEHPQITALQAATGASPLGNWGLEARTAFEMPESEWGTLPPLHHRVAEFARENAYEFVPLEGPHPEFFSYLAFRVWHKLLSRAGIEPQGIFLETFTQVAPLASRSAALLPVWIPWNCTNSLKFLQRVQRDFRQILALRDKPVFWLPLPTFVETFDMVPWESWLDVLKGLDVRPMGMRPQLYPADPEALYATREAFMAWVAAHPAPVDQYAPLELILEEMRVLRRQPLSP